MKKSKFLSVLVLGALMGAMTLSTTNSANADTNITINGTGTGGSNTWTSATADADGLEASGGGNSETYDYWVHRGGSSGDTLTMTGGSLIINSLPNGHDWIKASGGDITVNNGPLNINSDSNIQSAVNLVVNGTGTVNVTGGSVVINNGDTVSGKINATAGTITFGDTRTLDSSNYTVSGTVATVIDGNITSNISLAGSGGITVNSGSGKQLTINANNVDAALTNNGKVILNGGTLGNTISGAGATEITGNAGVSRTAFYRNYETKEALVEDICQNLYNELKASVSGELYRTDRKEWYTIFFRTIKENSEYFQIYLNAHLQFGKIEVLESVYPHSDTKEHYTNSAKEGAFVRILTDWFRGGMKESPQEMGELCEQLIYNIYERR